MRISKKIRFYLISGIIVLAGIILLFNKIIIIGLVILGLAGLALLLYEVILKNKDKQIDALSEDLEKVKSEKREIEHEFEVISKRKLNISDISPILELGLFEVDTNFKRTVNKQLKIKEKRIQFFGVLNIDFVAKYGVDIRKLMCRIDEKRNEIYISNANPEFLSFSKRSSTWEIAEILEFNIPVIGSSHWRTNLKLESIANEIKEEIRVQVEKETENGPSELKWIANPLRKHVERALELILGLKGYSIRFTELDSGDYKPLFDLSQEDGLMEESDDSISNDGRRLPE